MTTHIKRQDMIRAAKGISASATIDRHVAQCEDCREFLDMFKQFPVSGQLPLASAPSGWVTKAADIMTSGRLATAVKRLVAKLSFDSWSQPALAGVRSVGSVSERRVRFETDGILFDLRVEQEKQGYLMTARLTRQNEPCTGFVVTHPAGVVGANANGYYDWSSPRPPKKISLKSNDVEIVLPEIVWNRPKTQ
jgi:hypothetical protein